MASPSLTPVSGKPRIAIIGSGIAGLGCAHLLNSLAELTIFEKNNRIGGHSNTITVTRPDNIEQPIDTGFMVYNSETYPNLCKLFNTLGIKGLPTDMSFSVHHQPDDVTWCGSSLNQIFGQRKNILRPKFWRMVKDLQGLCSDVDKDLSHPDISKWTIRDYVNHKQYSSYLTRWFILPMASAIWSTHPERILDFPARTLLRFYQNHRFLQLGGHLQWYTVPGGAKTYIQKLIQPFNKNIRIGTAAVNVWHESIDEHPVACVKDSEGQRHYFDAVILASHADESLALLSDATDCETNLLTQYPYEKNTAVLHTDTSVLPPIKRCWAAWNYTYTNDPKDDIAQAATHYWMNRLQHISGKTQYIVSINGESVINPVCVLSEIPYTHPRYTLKGIQVQEKLSTLNTQPYKARYYCGSYFKYGFHEDAFSSAIGCAQSVVNNLSNRFPSLTGKVLWP